MTHPRLSLSIHEASTGELLAVSVLIAAVPHAGDWINLGDKPWRVHMTIFDIVLSSAEVTSVRVLVVRA